MIASKILGLVAFPAALLAVAVAMEATAIIRRTPKSTRDPPQSMTVRSTNGRASLVRNIAVDSVGRTAEESVGGLQQGTNAQLQINAQGDVINTGSKESWSSKNSMEDVTGEYAHGSVSAPSLCHEEIVSDMCMALNYQTKEYYNTETDADTNIVHAAEIAEQLSASKASVLNFLNEIGVTNLETDKYLLEHGAFAVKCMDLCLKALGSIPEHLRPPTSDVACVSSADPLAAPDCNIDVSPKALDAITDEMFHPDSEETDEDVEWGLKEADKNDTFEATEKEKNGIDEILDQQNEDKSFEQIQVDIALLFRIHPVANVSIDMDDDKNISDEPHSSDAEHASRTHFLNISFLDRLGHARRPHKARTSIKHHKKKHDIPRLNALALAWLSSTVNMMAGGRANSLVEKFFRSPDCNTIRSVRRTINSAVNVLEYVEYTKATRRCRPRSPAHVYPKGSRARMPAKGSRLGKFRVYLCDLFWSNKQARQVQTLVHEAMHHYSALLKDEAYGCSKSRRLSRRRALNNADSFTFFAMEAHGRIVC